MGRQVVIVVQPDFADGDATDRLMPLAKRFQIRKRIGDMRMEAGRHIDAVGRIRQIDGPLAVVQRRPLDDKQTDARGLRGGEDFLRIVLRIKMEMRIGPHVSISARSSV